MNLFDALVNTAIENQPTLARLRVVVEKELLHHDILSILSQQKLLSGLTFMGGTCLRACYQGVRLSEDLDFTGGTHFDRASLTHMGDVLIETLQEKYGLPVEVKAPIKDLNNVDTWKLKIITRPQQRSLPSQKINIDICRIPSYEKQPMLLRNPYGVDMGTSALVIQAESREEIFTDKLLAFALRPNRIKSRDLWDILWLHQQGISPRLSILSPKLADHCVGKTDFWQAFDARLALLTTDQDKLSSDFHKEMQRFLPDRELEHTRNPGLWTVIVQILTDIRQQ